MGVLCCFVACPLSLCCRLTKASIRVRSRGQSLVDAGPQFRVPCHLTQIKSEQAVNRTPVLILLWAIAVPSVASQPSYDAYALIAGRSWTEATTADQAKLLHQAESEQELAALLRVAQSGDIPSACLLGRIGMRHDEIAQMGLAQLKAYRKRIEYLIDPLAARRVLPPLVEGDYGDTPKFLEQCALGGDIDSFLTLAVYESRRNNHSKALVWAAILLTLESKICPAILWHRQSIVDTVIKKARDVPRSQSVSDEEVFNRAQEYLTRNLKTIISGHNAGGTFTPSSVGIEIDAKFSYHAAKQEKIKVDYDSRSFFSNFLLEIDAGGKVVKIIPLDTLPGLYDASFFYDYVTATYETPNEETGPLSRLAWIGAGVNLKDNEVYSVSEPGCRQ